METMMNARITLLMTLFLLAASVLGASAQTPPLPAARNQGYLAALAGATVDPGQNAVFSVEYGDDINRNVQAYATFSYFENLLSPDFANSLNAIGASLTAITGSKWEFTGRDRGAAFVVGGKYLIGTAGVRPYLGAGLGAINIKRTVVERFHGEVATALLNDFNLGEPALSTSSATRPLAEGAIGVEMTAGPTYVDVAYRYRRAFRLVEPLSVSQVSVGLGYRF
jgi:hypothetical protein